jgi:hypothetical protein
LTSCDHRDPAAEPTEGLRKLHSDTAAAEYDEMLGQPVELQRLDLAEGSGLSQARYVGNGSIRAEIEKDALRLLRRVAPAARRTSIARGR